MKQNTTRKNKTNQVLNMPKASFYTLKELFDLNTHFNAEITIRVRHTKMIEDGKVAEIGAVAGGKGRPQKVFAVTPVTQTLLNKAKAENINLVDNADKLVNAINVSTPTPTAVPVQSPGVPTTV
jgi:hypothetical protein